MDKITEYKNIAMDSLSTMWVEMTKIFPSIIGALIVLIFGWLVTKLVVRIIKKALKLAKADKLDDKLNEIEIVEGKKLNFDTIKIVSTFVKWILYIMILIIISDILNLKIISEQISNFLNYLPKLFVALIIFTAGLLFANFVKKGLQSFFESMDLSGSKIISQIVFFLLLIFISITALNQAGIDTQIITENFTMILAAFLLAFALAFGLGAKEVVGDLLKTFYTRKTFEVGKKIEFQDEVYEIDSINNISVVLKNTHGKKVIVPVKDIVENHIKVVD
ncbi:mechanosensitive ion channel domain-containing protein [Psychroserpens sp. SPM9]|uniref:mechanosensitive ion channel family protein n=1 Tax=Psychroserpens sp. SPM9 TaxID=2975598 RepID=UPI0021A7D2E7|nr:mechanosensitive ion channel domain-containing protein [Psychroserpens sp. SPM9]MDG5491790.1 mechanosensitive ion channel [Psychroserpens sp. SPM9]